MARVDGLINVCCRPNVACRLLKSYRAGLLRHRSECTPTADALSSSELSIASSLAGVVLQMCFDEFVVQAWPTASVSSAATVAIWGYSAVLWIDNRFQSDHFDA